MSIKRIASIVTGCLSALGLAYVGLAGVWGFGYANEVQETVGIIVQLLSTALAVITGVSITTERNEAVSDAQDVLDALPEPEDEPVNNITTDVPLDDVELDDELLKDTILQEGTIKLIPDYVDGAAVEITVGDDNGI
jgi:hypothetical protein